MGGGRYPESNTPRRRLLREEHFQFGSEEVSGETELAALFVEDGDQIIGQDVTVRIWFNKSKPEKFVK